MTDPASLADRRNELTRRIILDAALAAVERGSVRELTIRAVAGAANVSERTVFRHFASRDELLDAVAGAVRERLALPPLPATERELLAYPRGLFTRFEAAAELLRAALDTEISRRMRETEAKARWNAVRRIVDGIAPRRSDRDRRIAAANVRFHLSASSWHYYRGDFGLSLEDTIACAETAIAQALDGLRGRPGRPGGASRRPTPALAGADPVVAATPRDAARRRRP